MTQRKRHGSPLFNHGFSLLEVSIGLAVVALALSVLLPLAGQILVNAKEAQTRNNLQAIGRACQQYYLYSGSQQKWPAQVSDLQPYFLSAGIDPSGYVLNPQANILMVSLGAYSLTVVKPNSFSFSL